MYRKRVPRILFTRMKTAGRKKKKKKGWPVYHISMAACSFWTLRETSKLAAGLKNFFFFLNDCHHLEKHTRPSLQSNRLGYKEHFLHGILSRCFFFVCVSLSRVLVSPFIQLLSELVQHLFGEPNHGFNMNVLP